MALLAPPRLRRVLSAWPPPAPAAVPCRCASSSSSGSSSRYMARQQRDPYVKMRRKAAGPAPPRPQSQEQGALAQAKERSQPVQAYASRAAFKLIQLDDIYHFLNPATDPATARRLVKEGAPKQAQGAPPRIIVDLGAAPGGWTQVALARAPPYPNARIFALDIQALDPLVVRGATVIQGDFLDADIQARFEGLLREQATSSALDEKQQEIKGPGPQPGEDELQERQHALLEGTHPAGLFDVVLSDMMASTTGNPIADTEASLHLARSAFLFAARNLRRPPPTPPPLPTSPPPSRNPSTPSTQQTYFVCKIFPSPSSDAFRRAVLERAFERVRTEKGRVEASRRESRECFWVCKGFKGLDGVDDAALFGSE